MDWQPMETAPKGNFAELRTDPGWVEPPKILIVYADGNVSVGKWDWYYAEGGAGHDPNYLPWYEPVSGERLDMHYSGGPIGWMPLPNPPNNTLHGSAQPAQPTQD